MKHKKNEYEDDGRTIVNMNVDGMPWYRPKENEEDSGDADREQISLNRTEGRAALWGALKAALLIGLVFATVYFLFILFCDKVWLK